MRASTECKVTNIFWSDIAGNIVEVEIKVEDRTLRFQYMHLSKWNVEVGDILRKGQKIAEVGNTGSSTTGPHLHLTIKENGITIDPFTIFEPKKFNLKGDI